MLITTTNDDVVDFLLHDIYIGPEKSRFDDDDDVIVSCYRRRRHDDLSTLTTDSAGELYVFRHNGHSLGVDGAQVGVLKQTNEIGLASLLKSHYGGALETQIGLEVLSDFTDKTLEWQLADEQLGALLVATNLAKSDRSWPVTMRFLDAPGCWSALAGGLCCQLLPGRLATGRLTSSLLRTCHSFFF